MNRPSSVAPLTIGLPVYNGARWLEATFASLRAQSWGDFVLHIADNASTDATEEICRDLATRDPRVRYERHARNLGAVANFNHVAQAARSPLFKWAAADDLLRPRFLERCIAALGADPSAVLAMPRTQGIDEHGDDVIVSLVPGPGQARTDYLDFRNAGPDALGSSDPVQRFRRMMQDLWFTVQLYGVIRTPALQATAMHPHHYMGDHILLSELVLHGRFAEIDEVLFERRVHPGQTSAKASSTERVEVGAEDREATAGRATVATQYPARLRLHLAGIARSPLSPRDKIACVGVLVSCTFGWARRRATSTAVPPLDDDDERAKR